VMGLISVSSWAFMSTNVMLSVAIACSLAGYLGSLMHAFTEKSLLIEWSTLNVTHFFIALVAGCSGLMLMLWHYAEPKRTVGEMVGAAIVIGALFTLDILLAYAGLLAAFPLFPIFMALTVLLNAGFCFGALNATPNVPWSWLVGSQAFRLPVEIYLHVGESAELVPVQLTWSGQNVDVLVALLAAALGYWAWRNEQAGLTPSLPPAAQWAFGLIGFTTLLNILRISMLSMPGSPILAFPQTLAPVLEPPFILLPLGLFQMALMGQFLVLRRAWGERNSYKPV